MNTHSKRKSSEQTPSRTASKKLKQSLEQTSQKASKLKKKTHCWVRTSSVEDWWQNAAIYQIYPRSFKDSNNDGIGDLAGIIEKLDHLKNAGVTAAWISPFYPSPQVDAGYDVSNFKDVDPVYGNLDDFVRLVEKARSLGIKIILDFVANHTSDQHEWFKFSEAREKGYEDFYVWRDGNPEKPPNNWVSVFKNSAWTWSTKRKQFYLHQFAPEQPDLNYRNPKVVEEMLNVLTFWMDKGVDGFRVDAIPHLVEDDRFLDEPKSYKPNLHSTDYDYLDHIYTKDQPLTYDMVAKFRKHVDDYSAEKNDGNSRIIITEAYTSLNNTIRYYGGKEKPGAHFSFNFLLITDLNKDSTAETFVNLIENLMRVLPKECTPNWVLGNHDNHRTATRFGKESIDGLNMLLGILPGIAITYNGEEIGMEDGEVNFEEGQDPMAIHQQKVFFNELSRDFERTPFHWDPSKNAGFNTGGKPWLPVSKKYLANNLSEQVKPNIKSHFKVYQKVMALRKTRVFQYGKFTIDVIAGSVIAILRKLEEEQEKEGFLYVFNKSPDEKTIDVSKIFNSVSSKLQVKTTSVNSLKGLDEVILSNNIYLTGYEAVILVEIN